MNYFLDTGKLEGVKGTYLSSRNDKEIQNLLMISESISLGNKLEVWAYEAKTLNLINNALLVYLLPSEANYFNVEYRTISRDLDTKVATNKNNLFL